MFQVADNMRRWAKLSEDGRYRYQLGREWDASKYKALFIGLNPSTADAYEDDATCKKWIGFCKTWGLGGFVVGNLFALVETHSEELRRRVRAGLRLEVLGEQNDHFVSELLSLSDVRHVIPCWGAGVPRELSYRMHDMKILIQTHRGMLRPECFGLTKDGQPAHPLRLSYSTRLQRLGW